MAVDRVRRAVPAEFHAVGDIVLLDSFNVKDCERDICIRILYISHLLWTMPDVHWVRILGVEIDGGTEKGPHSLFVVHREALARKAAEV
jgi:hypothetical protein